MKRGLTDKLRFFIILAAVVVVGLFAVSFLGGVDFFSKQVEKAYVTGYVGKDFIIEGEGGYCNSNTDCPPCKGCSATGHKFIVTNPPRTIVSSSCNGECTKSTVEGYGDSGCPRDTPLCDGYGECAMCNNDDDCISVQFGGYGDPYCNTQSQCECDIMDDCPAWAQYCNYTSRRCVECKSDLGCEDEFGDSKPFCDLTTNMCGQCRTIADCNEEENEVCVDGKCSKCEDDTECLQAGYGICDLVDTMECVECLFNTDCTQQGLGICYHNHPDRNKCVECKNSCDCPGNWASHGLCNTNEECMECDSAWPYDMRDVPCKGDLRCNIDGVTTNCSKGLNNCVMCTEYDDCSFQEECQNCQCKECINDDDTTCQGTYESACLDDECVQCKAKTGDPTGDSYCPVPGGASWWKYCNANVCRECRTNAHCEARYALAHICTAEGTCVIFDI